MKVARTEKADTSRLDVGVAELRAQLSRYLTLVRQGAEIVVTDHGHPVAYITARRRNTLDDLIARGRARAPALRSRTEPKPVEYDGTLDDITRAVQARRR
ncbi:MAG TPA: type II toxin-antitoxin system prevent-host-death family antitoxin [Candidatus Dormibacteraeota bacterium]|nr:type II toxin-antitoxin system prevent-host-death family antitoxin [Candidatus Dormibacteraeota bacterium]